MKFCLCPICGKDIQISEYMSSVIHLIATIILPLSLFGVLPVSATGLCNALMEIISLCYLFFFIELDWTRAA